MQTTETRCGATLFACFLCFTISASARSNELERDHSATPPTSYDVTLVKAELEALQTVVLLSPKSVPDLREQLASLKARVASVLNDAALGPGPVSKPDDQGLVLQVTGSISRAPASIS